MKLLDRLNALSKVLLGVGIVDLWKQAYQSKAEVQKAERLAQQKHLREAAMMAEKTLAIWSSHPGFWKRLICRWLLGNLLDQLKQQLEQWRKRLVEVDKLAEEAKALLKKDTRDPLESQALSQALALYERCSRTVHDEKVLQEINQCQRELQRRQQFQELVTQAEAQAEKQFFKAAIAAYRKAEQLYPTDAVKAAIATYVAQIKQEKTYLAALQQIQQASESGRLRGAIARLESALTNFPARDGIELLEQLQRTVKGREQFRAGLTAEQAGNLKEAASLYETATALLPDPTACRTRLGVLALKTQDWAKALTHLEGIESEQAAYLRGYAHVHKWNLKQAAQAWQALPHPEMASERQILQHLAQRQRLLTLEGIEQLVKAGSLEAAKATSETLLEKFGFDPLVQGNLDNHIQPRLAAAVWQNSDWAAISEATEQAWLEQPSITSLHNWAVATYYRAQSDPTKLSDLIVAWSTALANLPDDPALGDVPWLGTTPVDFRQVSLDLQRLLEEAIDTFKDQNINEYLKLRHRYRLEVVALRLMGEPPTRGMMVRDVFVTPGCYQRCHPQWRDTCVDSIDPGQDRLRSLYTPWGVAVAACLEGDTQRAMQLKPSSKPAVEAEFFAKNFVAYHEGCYQLQHQQWREAMTPLKQAQAEIKASTAWQEEVDRLCGVQRIALSGFREHLEFAQFWYHLLGSQLASSYLAEYKAEQLRQKLADEQISTDKALRELQEIKQIDQRNPVVLDLIDRVELSQELEEINRLFRSNQLEEILMRTRQSRHQRVHYIVAKFFIDILINGIKSDDFNDPETIQQIGRWAYEICPDEPAFQEIYHTLRLRC